MPITSTACSRQGDGVEIWAHGAGRGSFGSDFTASRLEQRRRDLAPYVYEQTRLLGADRWLEFKGGEPIAFTFGGLKMRLIDVSGAHSPEDIMLFVEDDGVLLAGDLYFSGRLPFVGQADCKAWLAALDRIEPLSPKMVIPGHGAASRNPKPDIELTRRYLLYLRETMGAAVRELVPFEDAYKDTDLLPFYDVPAFEVACGGGDGDISGMMSLESPIIHIPNTKTLTTRLSFEHYAATEAGWDGGDLKISINGGPYSIVPSSAYTFNPYNTTLQTAQAGHTNPLAGQPAFSGTDGGSLFGSWGQSQIDLAKLGVKLGDNIQLRYNFGMDGCTGNDGWYVDNVTISACNTKK